MPSERWKDVVGYEGLYMVSDRGRVRSLARVSLFTSRWGVATARRHAPRIMRPTKSFGYLRISLSKKTGEAQHRRVHHLVLEAFVGRRPKGRECRHINGKRHDCRLKNLAWATHKENEADKLMHGTLLYGERSPSAKLSRAQVCEIRRRYVPRKVTTTALAEEFGVNQAHVSDIINGRRNCRARG